MGFVISGCEPTDEDSFRIKNRDRQEILTFMSVGFRIGVFETKFESIFDEIGD